MEQVFVSYSRKDEVFVLKLINHLKQNDVPVWLDQLNISGGSRWDTEVEKALKESTHFLIILSPASVSSQNVLDEVGFAIDERKTIIPILIEECDIPLRLRRVQYTDFRSEYANALANLVKLLASTAYEQVPTVSGPRVHEISNDLKIYNNQSNTLSMSRLIFSEMYGLLSDRESEPISLTQDVVIVGRDESCDIVITEQRISRTHVRFQLQEGKWYIEDMESRNGTWLNGNRLEEKRELSLNDEINIALVIRMRFVEVEAVDSTSSIFGESSSELPNEPPNQLPNQLPSSNGIALTTDSRMIFINGLILNPPLALPQYKLLELFYNKTGSICTLAEIGRAVEQDENNNNAIDNNELELLVNILRGRIAELDPAWHYIVTVPEQGYRLNNRL